MISDLDETIRQLLINEGRLDPTEIDVSFDIPTREWSASISRPTVNCYLFDIRENLTLREDGWQVERKGSNGATRVRPLLRYDLSYLITAWTRAVEDEHRLIWHTLRTLAHYSTLPEERRQGELREQDVPLYTSVARPDGVLKSPGEFWTALENHLKPSFSYVVTVPLDRLAIPAGPPVLTTSLRFLQRGEQDVERVRIGGTVRQPDGAPVAKAVVEVEGHAFQATSDAAGHFQFENLAPGSYTLVARAGQSIVRRTLTVPAPEYDLTMEPGAAPA